MDYILSEKNKGFLWNILYEKNIFNGIPNDNLEKVKNLFESTIVNVSQNTKNREIIEINKEILRTLNTEIQSLKRNLLESKNIKDEFVITTHSDFACEKQVIQPRGDKRDWRNK